MDTAVSEPIIAPGQGIVSVDEHVDAFAVRTACGPDAYEATAGFHRSNTKPILIMPNAGYPTILANRTYFRDS